MKSDFLGVGGMCGAFKLHKYVGSYKGGKSFATVIISFATVEKQLEKTFATVRTYKPTTPPQGCGARDRVRAPRPKAGL